MIFKDSKVYDVMKWVSGVGLPALAALILGIGQIWGWTEWTIPIAATVTLVAGFADAVLGISSIKYAKQIKNEAENG